MIQTSVKATQPFDLLKDVKSLHEIHKEGYQYVKDRYDGKIKSVRTPWSCFNDATLDGLEWGSVLVLAARPGSGKTLVANKITRMAHPLNPDQDFVCLDFQFDMSDKSTALRDFAAGMQMSYKDLANVGFKMNEYHLNNLQKLVEQSRNSHVFQISTPMTVNKMRATILQFMEKHKKPVIITIDHSMLIQAAPGDHNDFGKLFELGLMINELKRASPVPVIFIVLTQMNRSIQDRNNNSAANGDVCNYPISSDVYGGDALLMTTDVLIAINRPSTLNLTQYGPNKYVVNDKLLAFHFLKSRNGENDMFFFEENFKYFDITEINPPPMATGGPPPIRTGGYAPLRV